jgi:apolipoprotein N-acyltransferase
MSVWLSVISGLLLALAFPKFSLGPFAWLALVPFFYALNRAKTLKEALAGGLFFGLVFFGINLFWITSLFRFAGWWAVTAWGALAVFQTLFILLFVLLSWITGRGSRSVLIPIFWVAIEWLRAQGPFGVTSGDIGYSQAHFLPLIQIASYTQVYGVSFLVVFFNSALAALFPSPASDQPQTFAQLLDFAWNERGKVITTSDQKNGALLFTAAVLLVVASCLYGFYVTPDPRPQTLPKLAFIQPNIDQFDKMNPRLVNQTYDIHESLTRQAAAAKPEIIIWPETSLFTYLLRDPVLLPRVKQLAQEVNAWLVIGTPHYNGKGLVYNSLVSISPSGEIVSIYDKERLVPFGEYLPFRALLFPLLKGTGYFGSAFNSDPTPQPVYAGQYKIAAAICFESTFPDLIKTRAGKSSDFILTVTNDGWFDDSAAPYQHFESGIFRAVENRKYFVQVGNTGFSGVIDPYGRILQVGKLNWRGVILSE